MLAEYEVIRTRNMNTTDAVFLRLDKKSLGAQDRERQRQGAKPMRENEYYGLTKGQLDLFLKAQQSSMTLKLRLVITYSLLTMFAISVFSVLTMIFLVGFDVMDLPQQLILTLIGGTIAQAATIFLGITRFLFSPRQFLGTWTATHGNN